MMVYRHCLGIMLCFAVLAPALVASGQAEAPRDAKASQSHYAFDVVSIRPSAKEGYTHWHTGKDGYFVMNITAKQLVYSAFYKTDSLDGFDDIISVDQIGGLPGWAESEQFDVTAKLDEQTMNAMAGMSYRELGDIYSKMLLPVLRERFHLEVRHEKREQPVYLLVAAREGSKLVESHVPPNESSMSTGIGQVRAKGYGIAVLVGNLVEPTGRMIIDQTHLKGIYDYQLKWRPDDSSDANNTNPSIFTAVKEQLGLQLIPSKGSVDTIVVSRIDRPSSN